MKNKTSVVSLFILLVLSVQILFTSCGNTNQVVSSSFMQKRKYTKGYHFSVKTNSAKLQKEAKGNTAEAFEGEVITLSEKPTCTDDTEKEISRIDVNVYKMTSRNIVQKVAKNEIRIEKPVSKASVSNNYKQGRKERAHEMGTTQAKRTVADDGKRVNGNAIASFFFGLLAISPIVLAMFGFFFLYAGFALVVLSLIGTVLSILLGAIALSEINNDPERLKGAGFAAIGIALGVMMILLTLILIMSFSSMSFSI